MFGWFKKEAIAADQPVVSQETETVETVYPVPENIVGKVYELYDAIDEKPTSLSAKYQFWKFLEDAIPELTPGPVPQTLIFKFKGKLTFPEVVKTVVRPKVDTVDDGIDDADVLDDAVAESGASELLPAYTWSLPPWVVLDCRQLGEESIAIASAQSAADASIVCRIKNEVSGKPLTAEDVANAQLIAAAPKLYQELDEVLTLLYHLEDLFPDASGSSEAADAVPRNKINAHIAKIEIALKAEVADIAETPAAAVSTESLASVAAAPNTHMSFEDWCDYVAIIAGPRSKELRLGQHAFNTLQTRNPSIASRIVTTEYDPFYVDARMPLFLKRVLDFVTVLYS